MIKITKIKEAANPDFKSADWKSFVPGIENEGVSLPVDYWVKGELLQPLQEGSIIYLSRTERNGVASLGFFTSTKILSLKEENGVTVVETQNSVYIVTEED